jgi:hypothetical protein
MTDRYDPFDVEIPFKGERDPEEIRVVNLRKTLPLPKIEQADKLVDAGMAAQFVQLGVDELHTIANAVTDLDAVRADLREGRHVEVYGESAVLTMIRAEAMLTALFPLTQPRIAGEPALAKPPRVSGRILDGKTPIAAELVEFDDEEHLLEHLEEQIQGTLDSGSDLRASILSHGVTEPLLAFPAVVVAGDIELDVMALGDGITRFVRAWHNILGGDIAKPHLAEKIVEMLLARGTSRRKQNTESGRRREGRREVYEGLRARVIAHGEHYRAPEVVRITQSATVPVNITVGFRSLLPAESDAGVEHQFPDAIGSAVAQIHTLGRAWTPPVVGANVMAQAIQRAVVEGAFPQHIAEIAQGSRSPEMLWGVEMSVVPDPGLARSILLAAILLEPPTQKAIKRNIRSLRGLAKVFKDAYAGMLISVIDQPWRSTKRHARGNAASVWRVGGPIPNSLYDRSFRPMLVEDYLDLVEPALDDKHGDHWNALATLQVAGGIALVADGLLLSPTGSSTNVAPERISPQSRVFLLSRSKIGLCALAHAANSFRSDREATNSFTAAQRHKLNELDDAAARLYVVARPDTNDPFIPVYDPNYGFTDIVEFCKLGQATPSSTSTSAASGNGDSSSKAKPRTPKQDAETLRTQALEHVTAGKKVIEELRSLHIRHPQLLNGEDPDLWRDEMKPPADDTVWMISAIIRDLKIDEPDDTFVDNAEGDLEDEGEEYQ